MLDWTYLWKNPRSACRENGIEHRRTKVKHLWMDGQVERTNRTINEANVKHLHYDDHRKFQAHLADFIVAYNFARRPSEA